MALDRIKPFSYVKGAKSFEAADLVAPRTRCEFDEDERPKTCGRSDDLNEFQLMRGKLRAVTTSPKPSPRQIWHPQENFIGPLQNYVPADEKASRAVSPADVSSGACPVPKPRTRGRSPQRKALQAISDCTIAERPKQGLQVHVKKQKARRHSIERPKTAKIASPDSAEERLSSRLSPDPAVCRTCGMSPERNLFEARPNSCGGIIFSPRLTSSPQRPYRSPSPIKFVTPAGVVLQHALPNVRSRSSTPDLELLKALSAYSPAQDDQIVCLTRRSSSPAAARRPKSASPVRGKPPKQPGAHLSENSPRTHWIVDRPCRSPSPFASPRGQSPCKATSAANTRPPSPATNEQSRSRPATSRGASPSKADLYLERVSAALSKRKQSPPPRGGGSRSNSRGRSQTRPPQTKKAAIKLLDDEPELAYTLPTMAIVKAGPDLPPPHTKLRPESPLERRPRSRSKHSAAFVVWKEQKIELPERSPKKSVDSKKTVTIDESNVIAKMQQEAMERVGNSVAYEGGDTSIAANIEAIQEAQEAMANASGESSALMFDRAIQNMRNEIGQSNDSMFGAVAAAAVNMQQEKASINSGDRAAAFHDEHAAGEKDDLPELVTQRGRRGSMRFSALGKIAGMGARSTIAQRKKMEKEAADAAVAAAAAAKSRPMSRASSRASIGDPIGGTLSKSASQTSLSSKIRSTSGVLGSISSLASNKSSKQGRGGSGAATNSPLASSRRASRASANAAYRAVTAASSLVKSPRTKSTQSINKTSASGAEDSDVDSVAAGSTPRGVKSRLQSRDSSNTIVNADGTITSNSRSSSMTSMVMTPPTIRSTPKHPMDSAASTVVQVSRMQGRRQSIVMQGQPLIATIGSTPEPISTPALTMKAAGSAAGKAAIMTGVMGGGVAPADVQVISEMPSGAGSGAGGGAGGGAGSSKAAVNAAPSKALTKGNESMGEELVARMDSVKVKEMDENASLPPSCCGLRGSWALKLAARKWPGLCTKCIKAPKPAKDKKWASTRKDLNAAGDPEMQATFDTARKKTLMDRLRCCACCTKKKLNSASSQAPVLPAASPPKITFNQRLKKLLSCAALRMSCSRCCAKISCRSCCAKISCACCCPCFVKCVRCFPCCKKCCNGAVADSTHNPIDEKNKSHPSLQSKRKSRSLPPDPIKRRLDPSLLEANSLIQTAIPVLPVPLAWICLVLNCVIPGLGTILSGAFCLCFGRPRFSAEDRPEERLGTFCLDIMVGVGQLFTVLFCLVGWGWSIWWGTIMVKLAKKHRRLMARAAEELAKPPVPRRASDPANKK